MNLCLSLPCNEKRQRMQLTINMDHHATKLMRQAGRQYGVSIHPRLHSGMIHPSATFSKGKVGEEREGGGRRVRPGRGLGGAAISSRPTPSPETATVFSAAKVWGKNF